MTEREPLDRIENPPLDPRFKDNEPHDSREAFPLACWALFARKPLQHMVDFFLDQAADDRWLSKADIERETGLSRDSVVSHVDTLVAFNLVESRFPDGHTQYRPATESEIFERLREFNQDLAAAYTENANDE